MTGERAAWQDVADDLFDAAGDVAMPLTVTSYLQGATYSEAIGGYATTSTNIDSVGIWAPSATKKYFKADDLIKSEGIIMLRGSDFSALLLAGSLLAISGGNSYKIGASTWDEAETGAYMLVSVCQ